MADATQTQPDTLLARLIVEHGLATRKEVDDCVALQAQLGAENARSLEDVLISNGIVTKRQIERLRSHASSPDDSATGKEVIQIPGYQILGKLGAGAMATVYKAKQLSLDRMVAIKILPRKHMTNPQFVERFYAEGRAAAKLNHNNIVGALDVGKAGETHFFVMEYVEGRTVFDELQDKTRYGEKDALNVVIQIARALEHAHKQGFIHRDVKPKNIMITNEGVAKLADMGLARAVSDREAAEAEAGRAFGTPYYISPEQIRGEIDVDFRADIYGLGATLYHMVTGQVPFEGANPTAVMHKHLKSKLTPPDHINPSLSNGISEIIEIAMAKDRNERYRTTTELLQDLEAIARGEPPLQARRKFDLSSLTALESSSATGTAARPAINQSETVTLESTPLVAQPLFWIAMFGWIVAVVLLILHAVR